MEEEIKLAILIINKMITTSDMNSLGRMGVFLHIGDCI
jgi:hypothetical protein